MLVPVGLPDQPFEVVAEDGEKLGGSPGLEGIDDEAVGKLQVKLDGVLLVAGLLLEAADCLGEVLVVVGDENFGVPPEEVEQLLHDVEVGQPDGLPHEDDSEEQADRPRRVLPVQHADMVVADLLGLPRLQHQFGEDAEQHVLPVVLLVEVLHLLGDNDDHIAVLALVGLQPLVAVVGGQFLQVLALEKEVVVFAEGHQ